MTLPPLPDDGVQLGATADDWRAAVQLAGAALAATGAAAPEYADEMIRMIEEHGPYVVIAPGLALAHARPGPEVHADGLAVVTLSSPVTFGHPHNDPVSVVAALANVFNDSDAVAVPAAAKTPDEVRAILGAPDGYPSSPLDAA